MKAVLQWVLRTMMKDQTGVMRTLPRKDLVDFNVMMTAERLMRNGIDPTQLKNANQVENAIKMIDDRPAVQEGITATKSAKIMDMKGKEIKNPKNIMGGEEVNDIADSKLIDDMYRTAGPRSLDEDKMYLAEFIAEDAGKVLDDLPASEQKVFIDRAERALIKNVKQYKETDAQIKARLEKSNKEAAQKIRDRKKSDDADDQESSYYDGPADFDPDADNETFATGGRAGFFMGGANPRGLGTLRKILNYMSKTGKEQGKFKGADLSALDMLRLSNPKRFNRLLEDVRGKVNIKEGIMGTDTVRAMQQELRGKRKDLVEKSLDVAKAMKADDDKIKIRLAKEAETTIIPQVKKQLMEGMGMSEEAAEKAARDMAEAAQNMKPLNAPPEITKEGILQLENVLKNLETAGKKKRDLNADGGRIGFKDGMTRRTFLKIFGGLVSLPIIGKVIAPLKLTRGVSKVPIIKTDDVPGKPEWFDQLVNKVIVEGDDVTKRFATGERQSIHQKTLDDGSVVRVTEDVDDGAIRVEYQSEKNVFGDDVQLQYKKPLPDEGAPDPKAEFTTAESGPVGRGGNDPDGGDFEIDVDEVGGTSIRDLDSDVSKLKEYATGQKPTMKELVQNKRRRDKAKAITEDLEAQSDAVIRRQGEMLDVDPDFASGGIARMLGE